MKKLMLIFSLVAIGFGCAKKDNNNTPAVSYQYDNIGRCVDQNSNIVAVQLCQNAAGNGYVYQNGQCVSTTTYQPAPQQYCQNMGGNNGYTYQNGQCVSTTTYQPAPQQYCQNMGGNTGYMYQNGQCVSTTTYQPAPPQYCQNGGGMGTGMGQQCYGYYSYQGRSYQCGITTNCSGYLMTSTTTGQMVQCL